MAEYIEREAAISAIRQDIMGGLNYEGILNRIPSADVAPVRHGRWEKNDDGIMVWWECSECHRNAWYDKDNHYDYCPNCGAKMDGGDSNKR